VYTLAATCFKQHESAVTVITRLLDRLDKRGIAVKTLLLDRQFCTSPVMTELQSRGIPYVMPLVFRSRKARRRKAKSDPQRPKTLLDFRRKNAGRCRFVWKTKQQSVSFDVVVAYKSYQHEKSGRRRSKTLLFAAWRAPGSPREIRELYRKRFAIESSYRQPGQARASTRRPAVRSNGCCSC
jgi:IS4 transposase